MKTRSLLTPCMALMLTVAVLATVGCGGSGDNSAASASQFTCPMKEHADVSQDKPGNCPKCGMKLVEKK